MIPAFDLAAYGLSGLSVDEKCLIYKASTGHTPDFPGRPWNAMEWEYGAPRRNRTADPIITNDVLYQLSYRGMARVLFHGWRRRKPGASAPDEASGGPAGL